MLLRWFFRDVVFVDINLESERVILMKLNIVLKELLKVLIFVELDSIIKCY